MTNGTDPQAPVLDAVSAWLRQGVVFTPPLGHYATRLGASIESALVLVPA